MSEILLLGRAVSDTRLHRGQCVRPGV